MFGTSTHCVTSHSRLDEVTSIWMSNNTKCEHINKKYVNKLYYNNHVQISEVTTYVEME